MLDKRKTNFFFSGEDAKSRLSEFKNKNDCYPLDVVVHLTTRCNHSCGFCYHRLNFKRDKHADYDASKFIMLLEELKGLRTKSLIISGGGEPLKHRDIRKMVQAASVFPFSSIYTNLDVHLDNSLVESLSKLNIVNVNINSSNPEIYKKVCGQYTNLYRVKSNLRNLVTVQTKVNGIITAIPESISTLEKTIEDLLLWGISRVIVSPAFDLNYSVKVSSESFIEDLERLKSKINNRRVSILEPEAKTAVNSRGQPICNTHYFDITIGANEVVYPCCNVAYLDKYGIVDLKYHTTFDEAWKSNERKKWIIKNEIECKTCWLAPASKQIQWAKK